jgi:hypothetical protein
MAQRMFEGVKVFAATIASEREALGDRVTTWLREHPELELTDKLVMQSSDERHHCVSILLFYRERE